jgi:hypothetical protein
LFLWSIAMNAPAKPQPPEGQADVRLAQPKTSELDIKAAHKRIAKRFPKVLAELAK